MEAGARDFPGVGKPDHGSGGIVHRQIGDARCVPRGGQVDGRQGAGEDPLRGGAGAGDRLEIPGNAFHSGLQELDAGEDQAEPGEDRARRARVARLVSPSFGRARAARSISAQGSSKSSLRRSGTVA